MFASIIFGTLVPGMFGPPEAGPLGTFTTASLGRIGAVSAFSTTDGRMAGVGRGSDFAGTSFTARSTANIITDRKAKRTRFL